MYWINAQKCRACLSCADACQVAGAIAVRNGRPVIDAAYCTDCGACVAVCPHEAIEQVGAATPEIIRPATKTATRTAQPAAPAAQAASSVPAKQRPDAAVPTKAQPREKNLPAKATHGDRMDIIRTVAEVGGALIVGIIGALKETGLGSGSSSRGSGSGMGMGSGRGAGRGRGGGGGRRFRNRHR